jgi:tRNA(fMet)-specific endonuclease VapC
MLKYMLDTNICIFIMKERPMHLRAVLNRHHDQVCLSIVTWMELLWGVEKSSNPEKNRMAVEGFVQRLETLDYDKKAAQHTAQLRAELARLGQPIGPYDTMIAGHARARGLILVTNNLREFARVPGLRLEDWVSDDRAHLDSHR